MDRIVLTTSLQPALDVALCAGAYRCLALLRSLAGHARVLRTLTCSLATQMKRSTNTIRTYRKQLAAAGYIKWTTDDTSGITTVEILEAVEPPSRRHQLEAQREAEAKAKPVWPREPRPKPWGGGAQFFAHFKSSKNLTLTIPPCTRLTGSVDNSARPRFWDYHPPVRTPQEQIAMLLAG